MLSTHMHADGGKKELLWNPVGVSVGFKENEKNAGVRIRMAGSEFFKYAVKALVGIVEETIDATGLERLYINWRFQHRANLRLIEATARRLDCPMERVTVTVGKNGNTATGSAALELASANR